MSGNAVSGNADVRKLCYPADFMSMEPDILTIRNIVGENERFINSCKEPGNFWIMADPDKTDDERKTEHLRLYLEKLEYVSKYADTLIQNAFQPEWYEFYGVNRDAVRSPEDMCRRLIFDSFMLESERGNLSAYLSNDDFMFGHYIELVWDYDWNLLYWEMR